MARIIIVDDEEMDLTLMAGILERAGHEVVVAEDGRTALELWREGGADVVVTDMIMPELDGLALIQALRDEDPDIPVIAISGISAAKLNKALRVGASAVLTKPVDPPEFLREISRVLNPEEEDLDIPDF